jgi:hypothetical protein
MIYRLLEVGEVIQRGDEYRSLVTGRWRKAKSIGGTVPSSMDYRRPYTSKPIISTNL